MAVTYKTRGAPNFPDTFLSATTMEPSWSPDILRQLVSSAAPRVLPSSASPGGGKIRNIYPGNIGRGFTMGYFGRAVLPWYESCEVDGVAKRIDNSPHPPLASAPCVAVYWRPPPAFSPPIKRAVGGRAKGFLFFLSIQVSSTSTTRSSPPITRGAL